MIIREFLRVDYLSFGKAIILGMVYLYLDIKAEDYS